MAFTQKVIMCKKGEFEMYIPGLLEVVIMLICASIMIIPFWKIFSKAGYNAALSLPMVIPVVGIILLFFLAFSEWPIEKKLRQEMSST